MKNTLWLLCILTAGAAAQQRDLPRTLWVARHFAPVYSSADYLASVVDTVWRGDSVTTLEQEGKFVRIEMIDGDGWVLVANLTRNRVIDSRGDAGMAGGVTDSAQSARALSPRNSDSTRQPRCEATTRSGPQCSRTASSGSRFCWQHGGRRQ